MWKNARCGIQRRVAPISTCASFCLSFDGLSFNEQRTALKSIAKDQLPKSFCGITSFPHIDHIFTHLIVSLPKMLPAPPSARSRTSGPTNNRCEAVAALFLFNAESSCVCVCVHVWGRDVSMFFSLQFAKVILYKIITALFCCSYRHWSWWVRLRACAVHEWPELEQMVNRLFSMSNFWTVLYTH